MYRFKVEEFRVYVTLFLFLIFHFPGYADADQNANNHYNLTSDPIDVVIVSHPKDKVTLEYCIDGIKKNCSQVRRVIVVSSIKLSAKAEWFDEKKFPFSLNDIYLTIGRGDEIKSKEFFDHHSRPAGWYFQQLLKLYSPFVIPGISSNVLVIDADTVFLNDVNFMNDANGGLFCISHKEAKELYFKHAERLVPGYKRIHPEFYSVCHHMLFQKPILEDLFLAVEQHHRTSFWVAFCLCVDLNASKGASEYEIYYNYALTHTDQVAIRPLKWKNTGERIDRKATEKYKKAGYHYISFQDYLRKKKPKTHKT